MLTSFKLKCIHDIEGNINVPQKNYFVKNPTSARLCYSVDNNIKYIFLPTPQEIATFLKKHGIIHSWKPDDNNVIMYHQPLITGKGYYPVQYNDNPVIVRWDDIEITRFQVQTFAAIAEYERVGGLMGITAAKVISMVSYVQRDAA